MAGTVANRRAERRTSLVQGTVLLIDDEADIPELLELSLVRMGLAVACARTDARGQPGTCLHYRRVRERQGARRAPHPQQRVAAREGLRARQLRRHPREPDGKRVLRL